MCVMAEECTCSKKQKITIPTSKISASKTINISTMAEERRSKKQKVPIPETTISAKTITVATRVILDDAKNAFKNGNFVCSPFSLEAILGMVAAGAEGKTLKQLLDFLGRETIDKLLYDSPSSKLSEQILSKDSNHAEAGLDIVLANGIWLDKKMNRVQSGYKEILKTVYKTKATFVDIENKPDESASEINSWANEKTRGLIPTIVEKDDLNKVLIVLANVLYFKGLWFKQFEPKMTKDKDFHLINGETVSVPFMTIDRFSYNRIEYGSFKGYQILKLPYKSEGLSNKFSMYIFLPDRDDGLQDLVQVFDSDHELFHAKYDLYGQYLDELWIPKFKISCKFEPQDVMEQMGLTLPFELLNMDLTRIVDSTHPDADKLYVSKILQKSFIEVDERGTEVVALSLIRITGGGPLPPPASFVADHPFMFMIREDTSLAVLFLGVVLNPKQN